VKCTAFGIVACYNSVHSPVPLFAMNVHQDLGWQTLSYLVCTVICVSETIPRQPHKEMSWVDVLLSQNSIISISSLADARSPRFTVRSKTILEVASRLIVEVSNSLLSQSIARTLRGRQFFRRIFSLRFARFFRYRSYSLGTTRDDKMEYGGWVVFVTRSHLIESWSQALTTHRLSHWSFRISMSSPY